MTPIEVLKMLKSKIDEAEFYKSNYVLQTNDVEVINQALRIHDVVGQSEQLVCRYCKTELTNPISKRAGYCDSWCVEREEAN